MVLALVVSDDAEQATETVEDERAEVGCERQRKERVGKRGHLVVRGVAEAGEDAVGQRGDGGVGGGAGVAEGERDGDDADDGRDGGQGPDGAPRRERFGVEHAEVFGNLIVLAHGVGNASAGVHAAQRGADEREEDGEGFNQHEVLAVALAEQLIADDNHHVADGRGRAGRALHGVPGVEKVVGAEVLKQVTEQSLDEQRCDDGDGNMLGWIFGLASHRGDRFKADQNQNRNRSLNEHPAEFVNADHRGCVGMGEEVAGGVGGRDR